MAKDTPCLKSGTGLRAPTCKILLISDSVHVLGTTALARDLLTRKAQCKGNFEPCDGGINGSISSIVSIVFFHCSGECSLLKGLEGHT